MFFGSCFASTSDSISNSASENASITSFQITGIVIDELYATKNDFVENNGDWIIPSTWGLDTYLHAQYKEDTFAGNVSYSQSIVSKIKLKKRFKGDFTWKTIYEKDINSSEDFNLIYYDYYEPSNRTVEYAHVAVIGGVDSNAIGTEVYSHFDSYFICDRDFIYPMRLDMKNSITYNRESKTIVSPGNKYPYVVNNGIARYYSGTINCTFIERKDCIYDKENGWKYRNEIDLFLTDGNAKILKSFEGDIWMVNIVGNLPRSENGHYQNISHQIDWVECGDPNMVADLYDHGFIDTDVDREQGR